MSAAHDAFEISVAKDVLDDLRDRLAKTRFPDAIAGAGWDYGIDGGYLRELCDYWRNDFDWRAQEKRLNCMPQFMSSEAAERLHFVHAPSREPDALPLILTHGWPGSVAEFSKVVEPLRDPASHGADARDAFHVVCPSLPGYGYSEPARERGMNVRRIAERFAALMRELGYARYAAQGGDWGAEVSTALGALDAEHCAAVHLNLVMAGPPKDGSDPMAGVTDAEKAHLLQTKQNGREETGYAAIQGTKPQTVGVGLNDSPAGLAAWIVEKFRAWSDCNGDVESRFTKDELLTNITLYWVTQSITSSARLYYETTHGERVAASQVPTGCALFPGEPIRAPRAWAERRYNIVHWREMPSGGHFAAMEEPELLVGELREFFRRFR